MQECDHVVCTCMEVMKSDIIKALEEGSDSFKELSDKLGVGMGCSSCVDEVSEILSEYQQKRKKV